MEFNNLFRFFPFFVMSINQKLRTKNNIKKNEMKHKIKMRNEIHHCLSQFINTNTLKTTKATTITKNQLKKYANICNSGTNRFICIKRTHKKTNNNHIDWPGYLAKTYFVISLNVLYRRSIDKQRKSKKFSLRATNML